MAKVMQQDASTGPETKMATRAVDLPSTGRKIRLSASGLEKVVSTLVLAGVVFAIVFGWQHRHDDWINPEYGFGYALGVVGGSMMLLLLAYPMRKRARPGTRTVAPFIPSAAPRISGPSISPAGSSSACRP